MKRIGLAALLTIAPIAAFAWPWSTDMMNQPSVKPQELPPGMDAMYPFPARSIPVQGIPTQISSKEEAEPLKSPVPINPETLKKGRQLFRIICSACHGLTGKADSPVSPKIGAINLTEDYVQKVLTEGWIFGTITFGGRAIMPAYGVPARTEDKRGSNDLSVEERWMVVNYVKHGLTQEPATTTAAAAK